MGQSAALTAVFLTAIFVTMVVLRIDATEGINTADNVANSDQLPFEYDNIRLPGNVIPLQYSLYLHPNITNGKFLYTGTVSIILEVKEETDSIVLHSLGLSHIVTTVVEVPSYENLSETRNAGKEIVVKGTTWHKKHEQAIVHLGSKLTKGMKCMLTIYFSGELTAALRGFYRSSYTTKGGEKRYLATTHFEPTGARLAFPCFDEPAMKAKFKISIVREKIHTALSNMPVEKEVHRPDGLIVDNFQESVKMSTYLVAFIVSDFVSLEKTSQRGITIKVWAPKDQISQAKYAIEIAPKILDYYETFFSVNFPLPKQDLIAIPDFTAGAMENWGLIVYRLTALLYDEKESSSSNKQRVATVIAHEMAHQWFGNLVTMKWWNDLWLNEGFAAFVEYIGTDHVSPDWKMMDQFLTGSLHTALNRDSHLQSHPILVPVKDPAEIGAIFDTITYSKGSSVIRMMSDFIGHDNFVHGLTNYLQTYKYGNAVSDDLWRTLSKETGHPGIKVKTVMDTWTLKMGYPVVNVQRIGEYANLTQERFVTDAKGPNNTNSIDYKWNIPLTFYYQQVRDKKRRWFHVLQKNVIIPWGHNLGWLKLNVDQVGFYRVNYDEQNWKALAMQLKKDHRVLSSADRANLIDDAFQLANIGKMTPTQALDLTEYLNKEKEYVPYSTAVSALGYFGDMLASRPGYAVYEKYILQQILPRVKTLGWNDVGSHLNKYIRGIVLKLAVQHNNVDAVKKAKAMYNDWMVNGKKIPANLRPTIYYAGIKYGGEKEWNFMYQKYQKCLYPSEKKLLMNSLTYTSNPGLLSRYLEWTLNKDVIREADAIFVMIEISHNPIGTDMLYTFLKKKWNVLIKKYHKEFTNLARLIKAAFGGGKTKDDFKKAKDFFDTHNMDSAKLAADLALDSIRNHIKWLETNEKSVVKWFSTKVKN